jgi:integrase
MAAFPQPVLSGDEKKSLLFAVAASTVRARAAEPASEGSMARRRYQQGRIFKRGKNERRVWVGRWREDVVEPDGSVRRVERSVVLGPVATIGTLKNAQRALEPFLAKVNAVDYRPGKFAKIGEFAKVWEREVLAHKKPSSVKAAESHLRTYILPWLGEVRMEEFTGQAQQNFVTRLSQRVSRKTTVNVLSTIASMIGTAKKWGYLCSPVVMRELALPAGELPRPTRFYSAEEVRRMIAVAPQPFRTMFAIAAMTGLRVGEVVALQRSDLDFANRLIHVQRSAWYGRVQTLKSKSSRADVVMPEALLGLLEEYLATWTGNPEGFLFLNRNGRPYAANKVVEYGLWPVLDKLKLPRGGMHAFRHAHASLLMDVGAPPTVTRDQMRHSDARVTLGVYGHVIGDAQREAVDKVGEILRPDAPKSGATGEWIQ